MSRATVNSSVNNSYWVAWGVLVCVMTMSLCLLPIPSFEAWFEAKVQVISLSFSAPDYLLAGLVELATSTQGALPKAVV